MRLKNKIAVIYGAGGGIGAVVAQTFAREGADLFLTGRNLAKVERLVKDIRAAGGRAEAAEVDALDEQSDIPKAAPEAVAREIFDGLERGEEDIFPDPVSQVMAEGWRNGVVKAFEHQYASLLPPSVASAA